jgi:hypothetical protein
MPIPTMNNKKTDTFTLDHSMITEERKTMDRERKNLLYTSPLLKDLLLVNSNRLNKVFYFIKENLDTQANCNQNVY